MNELVYNAGIALTLDKLERTFQIFLPSNCVKITHEKFYNSRVWVVIKVENEYFLSSEFYPVLIESFETEIGDSKMMMSADIIKSKYFISALEPEKNKRFLLKNVVNDTTQMTIYEITQNTVNRFNNIVCTASQYSFRIPNYSFPSGVDLPEISKKSSLHLLINTLIKVTKKYFSVTELVRDARNREWDEYFCFVFHYLSRLGIFDEVDIRNAINVLLSDSMRPIEKKRPMVDLDLRVIDPDKIKSRKFVMPCLDNDFSIIATEKAEERHQEILRDISHYLIARNIIPLESYSLDLVIKSCAGFVICEIKSANTDNFFRQCEKALSQLLRYDYEFYISEKKVLKKCLIVEHCTESNYREYIRNFLAYYGIYVMYYNIDVEWPERLIGIEDIIT